MKKIIFLGMLKIKFMVKLSNIDNLILLIIFIILKVL